MTKPSQETLELIVDVLTVLHLGTARYSHSGEHVMAEAADIRQRFKDLMAQGIDGVDVLRTAKVGWVASVLAREGGEA